jgi:hypothetical protein
LATKELADNSLSAVPKLTYCFDGEESTFTSGKRELSVPLPSSDYFAATEGVLIEVSACVGCASGLPATDIDSAYFYSLHDLEDCGMIEVSISMPPSSAEASRFLVGLAPELRGHLAHEMQHSIQRITQGQVLCDAMPQDLESHVFDLKEIDARVEEVIAQLADGVPESDSAAFTLRLKSYIVRYLQRNLGRGRGDPRYLMFYGTMLDTHLCDYKRKMGLEKADAAN